ncbi:augmin complex subunit dgt4-like [Teleopsis dalmanni]|uniref:augmin complex subunit dgt4-like n=1 Tax=Teleopsis dalmanni TaxID=139649 RepID=UPI0018CDDFD0|nr:augmin complex subunit dgt4-like [Teleopsis dalmanni]XP_037934293.1 augmin complex subunit dgt4-like [Teleopsis dalmanni]
MGSTSKKYNTTLDDINYLLYLETYKRFKDDENNIKRQIEEKIHQYKKVKNEYLELYLKYTNLLKLTAIRTTVEGGICFDDSHVKSVKKNIETIIAKISTGNVTEYVNAEALEKFKENLSSCENYTQIEAIKSGVADIKKSTKAIKNSRDIIETSLEAAAFQGLDFFAHAFLTDKPIMKSIKY